jgi:hypothetical protein
MTLGDDGGGGGGGIHKLGDNLIFLLSSLFGEYVSRKVEWQASFRYGGLPWPLLFFETFYLHAQMQFAQVAQFGPFSL